MFVWFAWLEKNFMTSAASAGFVEYAPSIRVFTPTNGDAAFPEAWTVGRVAYP